MAMLSNEQALADVEQNSMDEVHMKEREFQGIRDNMTKENDHTVISDVKQ